MKSGLVAFMLTALAVPASADDAPADKSDYTLFNPVPDSLFRSFNGKIEGGAILPVGVNAPARFTIIIMPEIDNLKDSADNGYHRAVDFLVNVSRPLDEKWTFYTEVFTIQSIQVRDKPVYTLDEALTYALTPNLQLDFGGDFSVNGAAPKIQLYTGLSQRF